MTRLVEGLLSLGGDNPGKTGVEQSDPSCDGSRESLWATSHKDSFSLRNANRVTDRISLNQCTVRREIPAAVPQMSPAKRPGLVAQNKIENIL